MPIDLDQIRMEGNSAPEGVAGRLHYVMDILDLSTWRTTMDVGACDGREATDIARLLPDVTVCSFEPVPANQMRCHSMFGKAPTADVSRIRFVPAALGETTGPITFHAINEAVARQRGNVNYGMGSILELKDPNIFPWELNQQMQIDAYCYSMDDWCQSNGVQQVDAIWMDVQGAELYVLKGAKNHLSNVQCIMTEAGLKAYYEGHTMKDEIDRYLSDFGFVELEVGRNFHPQGLEMNTIYVNSKFTRK